MAINSITERLSNTVKELSDLEVSEVHLLVAIINKKVRELINQNMKILENEFFINCEQFRKNPETAIKEKNEVLQGYRKEFDRIASKFEEEYMNIAVQLQNIQAKQKIPIANMKKMANSKRKYIKTGEYSKFLAKIENLEEKRDNCLVKVEFDKIINYLDNVKDPVDIYEKKIDAYSEQYIRYCGLEEACIEEIKKSGDHAVRAIRDVMQYDMGQLAVVNKKSIFSIFSKMLNKLSGAKRFEKKYLLKKKENIEKIKENTDKELSEIDKEIDNILAVLDACNSRINQILASEGV